MPVPAGDHDTIARAVTAYVNASLMARGHRIHPDDDFEAVGIDSMALLKILLFIEAEFGFWPPDEDLVTENLRSPRALARYVCRRRSLS
jgi:acyl carrier protein